MIHARSLAAVGLAAMTLSLAALAQAPVPLQRLQPAPATLAQPPLTPDGSASAGAIPATQPQGGDQSSIARVPSGRDRFGKPVYGDTCADSWVNCAYDPDRPYPQQSRLPDK
jgi:hypothetical protein